MYVPAIRSLRNGAILIVFRLLLAAWLITLGAIWPWLAAALLATCAFSVWELVRDIRVYRSARDFRRLKTALDNEIVELLQGNDVYRAVSVNRKEAVTLLTIPARRFIPERHVAVLYEFQPAINPANGRKAVSVGRRLFTFWPNSPMVNADSAVSLHDDMDLSKPLQFIGLEKMSLLTRARKLRKIPLEMLYADENDLRDIQTALGSFLFVSTPSE